MSAALLAAGKLIGQYGPALAQFIGGRKAASNLEDDSAAAQAAAEQKYNDLKANMPQYGVGSAWNQYLAQSKQDPAADMQRQIAAEQEATSIGALKSGGAKALLGGLGASQRQAAQSRMGIEAQSAARQQSALGEFAGQQQRVQDMNIGTAQQIDAREMQRQQQIADQASYNQNMAGMMKTQAAGDAIGGVLGAFGKGGLEGVFNGMDLSGLKGMFGGNQRAKAARDRDNALSSTITDQQMEGLETSIPGFFKRSGGMVTPGEFSHETNPIDMLKDGAKIGEMTGGEVILNPEQQEEVAKQSPIFRKLMREFAMKARK
jgi:hypothetical protein